MAKEKKSASDGGATKKQATETKKAAASPGNSAPKTTKTAASTTKATATAGKPSAAKEPQSAAGGAATKKKAPAKPGSAELSPSSIPLIDTSLAAAAAANFVMNRALLGNSAPTPAGSDTPAQDTANEPKAESSSFKQLKAGLKKPAPQGPGGILGNTNLGKKGNTGFGGGNQQTGRNQTFGADVNRAGVPRRTGG